MKLFKISQDQNSGYDTYDSAIVCAATEAEAKAISPSEYYKWDTKKEAWMFQYADGTEEIEGKHPAWADPDKVDIEYLGEAKPDMTAGVILTSFNAG